jgi:phage terminase large subunit-like protein
MPKTPPKTKPPARRKSTTSAIISDWNRINIETLRQSLRAYHGVPLRDWPDELQRWSHAAPFLISAHPAQVPPPGAWRQWLFMGGRGAGKTRAGAEWIRWATQSGPYRRIALVGPTLHDVREVMIGGASGLMSLGWQGEQPSYEPSRRRLNFPGGAVAYAFSAEDPDSLRGPQFDLAWCDEAAAWPEGLRVWNTLQMALRSGPDPRALVTTTPRAVELIRMLIKSPGTVLTRAATEANAANLAPGFVDLMRDAYGSSALARQEIGGELLEDPEQALFRRADIDAARLAAAPPLLDDCIVAIDPPASSGHSASACGIVAAGRRGRDLFVLGDASAPGLQPLDWARRAIDLARQVGAQRLVAECNQGGEMVRQILRSAGADLPVHLVRAHLGKAERARPVALLYAQRRVAHIGMLAPLEDEMCRFGADGFSASPDRTDALVWAITVLMAASEGPRITLL